MKPGPELDAIIAEKVMGLYVLSDGPEWFTVDQPPSKDRQTQREVKRYSTNIAHAFEVVEKVGYARFRLSGIRQPLMSGERYSASFGVGYADAETAPHAICLAALRAKGVEV